MDAVEVRIFRTGGAEVLRPRVKTGTVLGEGESVPMWLDVPGCRWFGFVLAPRKEKQESEKEDDLFHVLWFDSRPGSFFLPQR